MAQNYGSTNADLFPRQCVAEIKTPLLRNDKKFLTYLVKRERVDPFTVCLIGERVACHSECLDEWEKKTMDNFLNCAEEATVVNRFQPRNLDWDAVHKRLTRRLTSHRRIQRQEGKKSDVRLCFRIDRHWFLVKKQFTFGERRVELGTVHVWTTTDVPMVYYQKIDQDHHHTGKFRATDRLLYRMYVLQPETTYEIPEGTIYLVFALQKTLFSVHVLPRELTSGDGRDPCEHKHLVRDPYRMPPPTPRRHFEIPKSLERFQIPKVQKSLKPVQKSSKPVQKSSKLPVEPVQKKKSSTLVRPSPKPVEPSPKPVEPSPKPVEPSPRPVEKRKNCAASDEPPEKKLKDDDVPPPETTEDILRQFEELWHPIFHTGLREPRETIAWFDLEKQLNPEDGGQIPPPAHQTAKTPKTVDERPLDLTCPRELNFRRCLYDDLDGVEDIYRWLLQA